MQVIFLAVTAAVFFALTFILMRMAGREVPPMLGGLIISAVMSAGLLPWVAATVPLREYGNPNLLWYVGIGVLIPGFGRSIHIAGIQRIGAAPSALIRGLGPLFSSSLAVLVLGEVISVRVAAGTGFIVLGILALSIRQGEMRTWAISGVLFSLGATMTFVFRDLIIRYSSPDVPYKTLAIFAMASTSTVLMAAAWVWLGDKKIASLPRRSLALFVGVGVSSIFAQLFLFLALDRGEVVVVTPIVSAQPLFVMLLSFFLLRGVEKVTPAMVLGGAFITLGGALISLG